MERAENARRHELEAVLSGESGQLDLTSFSLLVEMDSPLARGDHQRLLYAASLALDYYEERRTPNQREFIRKVAAACQVEESDLRAYCLVLGNEIRYRAKTGAEPLRMLPHLVEANTTAEANKDDWPEASE
jgi:hypothetical protein